MASAFAHAAVAATMGTAFKKEIKGTKFWILGIVAAVLPDADVLAFNFGIPYEHMFGHRGFTHSIFFAFFFSFVLVFIFYRTKTGKIKKQLFLYFFLCSISHGILDAMTTGGRGIAFLAPFSADRFFFPWRVIQVSPMSVSRFFSEWGMQVIRSELFWIGIPCLVFLLLGKTLRKFI
jgi:inner membrane protein